MTFLIKNNEIFIFKWSIFRNLYKNHLYRNWNYKTYAWSSLPLFMMFLWIYLFEQFWSYLYFSFCSIKYFIIYYINKIMPSNVVYNFKRENWNGEVLCRINFINDVVKCYFERKEKKYVPFVYQLLGIMILYFFSWNREYDQCLIQLNNVCVKQNNDPR